MILGSYHLKSKRTELLKVFLWVSGEVSQIVRVKEHVNIDSDMFESTFLGFLLSRDESTKLNQLQACKSS